MKKKMISILLVTFLVGIIIYININGLVKKVSKGTTPDQKFFIYYNSGYTEKIPELFFFCSEPGTEKKHSFETNLKRKISFLKDYLGYIEKVEIDKTAYPFSGVPLYGEDKQCSVLQKTEQEFRYKVWFSNKGEGYIFSELCNDNSNLKIKELTFMFPGSNLKNLEILKKLTVEFEEIDRELIKDSTVDKPLPQYSPEILKVAESYFKYMQSGNFYDAAKLFYYDPYLDERITQLKINHLEKTLKTVQKEFGSISNWSLYSGDPTYQLIGFSGFNLNEATGVMIMAITTVEYKVNFSNEGNGFIIFDMIQVDNYFEISEVFYGLPSDRSGAESRLNDIKAKVKSEQESAGLNIKNETVNPNESEQLNSLFKNFIERYNFRDFDECIKMYHFNPNYSPDEKEKEIEDIKKSFSVLWDEFGTISNFSLLLIPQNYFSLAITSNSQEYWQSLKYPEKRQYYEVTFSKEGKGYMEILTVQNENKLEIKYISFGIAADKDGAQTRIMDINIKLSE
ncbi:MAG: hypothetical protein PHV06_03530 [bacterium]|nr:hypothetical protein [bacterium]